MADADDVIPAPTSLPEVGIHLSYIRRDIRKVGQTVEEGFKALDDHYVSRAEFDPVVEIVKAHGTDIDGFKAWMNTLNGKLIGYGAGIASVTAVITFLASYGARLIGGG